MRIMPRGLSGGKSHTILFGKNNKIVQVVFSKRKYRKKLEKNNFGFVFVCEWRREK